MSPLALQQSFFEDTYAEAPKTEGIKYAGSKLKLLPQIMWLAGKTNAKTIFDGFAGSTRVTQSFAKSGYSVISNDQAIWSKVFSTCYLHGGDPKQYREMIEYLNNLPPKAGWFTEHYGGDPNFLLSSDNAVQKRPWQKHNTMRLDAIRQEIARLDLNSIAEAVALTSLILALDKVDSTLGHFASYLREWSPRSYNAMQLKMPEIVQSKRVHQALQGDIFDVVPAVEADLAYYDPPYGSNNEKMPPSRVRYSAYYHIWTTICLNDTPSIFGKVNRRTDTRDEVAGSVFEEFRRSASGSFIAVDAIRRLLKLTATKNIILSYSSGGRATAKELNETLNDAGVIREVIEVDYRRNVMAGMKWTNEWLREAEQPNREFLFLIERH